jgi:hypothetical protein
MLPFFQEEISARGGIVKKVFLVDKNIGRDLLICSRRQKITFCNPPI